MFIFDSNFIYSLLFNKSLEQIGQFSAIRPDGNFDLISGMYADSAYHLVLTDKSRTSFQCITFDYGKRKVSTKVVEGIIPEKSEIVGAITINQKLYVVTLPKGDADMGLHIIDVNLNHTYKEFSFNDQRWSSSKVNYSFKSVVRKQLRSVIEDGFPVSTSRASAVTKIYGTKKELLITIDVLDYATMMISVDLGSLDANVSQHNCKFISCEPSRSQGGNSFINDGKIYQLHLCNDVMSIAIKDLSSNHVLKDHIIKAEEDMTVLINENHNTLAKEKGVKVVPVKSVIRKLAVSGVSLESSRFTQYPR